MLNLLSYVALVLGTSLIGIIVTLALVPSLRIKFFRMREGGDLALFPWIGDDVSLLTGHLHLTEPGPRNLQDHLRWMKNSPSGAYVLWAGIFWPVLNLMSPEVVQPILKSTSPKSYPYTKIHPWLGISLLTSAGDLWKRKRRQITPAFHYTILQGFQPVFCEKTELMLEHMGRAADWATPVDVFRLITLCTLDIIGMCAFGYEINASTEPNSPYVLATYELSELFYRRLFDPLLLLMPEFLYERITDSGRRWRRALDIIHKLPETVIAKRREGLQKGIDTGISVVAHQREYVDFLHILLTATDENGQPLTNQEIRDEVDTFMFEGHDTTSSGLVWAMYCIATNPGVQDRVIQEVDEVLGDRDYVEFDDLKKFDYLDRVIKETLRIFPPVPGIGRTLDEEVVIDGKRVPPGTDINIMPYVLHRNPKYWGEDAERFDPDRWLADADTERKNPFAYIPFSAGPRNCVGQHFAMNEERTILAMVFKKFRLQFEGAEAPEVEPHIVLRPKDGLKMSIIRRR